MGILESKSDDMDTQLLQETALAKPDERAALEFEKNEQQSKVVYVPSTFESLMETFGINLKRKN